VMGEKGSPILQRVQGLDRWTPDRYSDTSANQPITSSGVSALRSGQQTLMSLLATMTSLEARSRSVLFVSDGYSAGSVVDMQAQSIFAEDRQIAESARRGNVPIYVMDPRGLTSGFEDLAQVGSVLASPTPNMLAEVRQGQDRLRVLAVESGGLA